MGRHPDSVELDPSDGVGDHQAEGLAGEAGRVPRDDERGHPAGPRLIRGPGEHRVQVRMWRVGDERLHAREAEVAPVPLRPELDRGGVRTVLRLRQGERGHGFPTRHRRYVARDQLLASRLDDGVDAEPLKGQRGLRLRALDGQGLPEQAQLHRGDVALRGAPGPMGEQPGEEAALSERPNQRPIDRSRLPRLREGDELFPGQPPGLGDQLFLDGRQ
jgi:hypothetical protein